MRNAKAISILLILIVFLIGSSSDNNPVLDYFENSELQYEGKTQEENIVNALKDILYLTEEELIEKRYKDYTGNENQWDLQTLIYRHFVPDELEKTLGDNFFFDVKLNEVQEKIKQILVRIILTMELEPSP